MTLNVPFEIQVKLARDQVCWTLASYYFERLTGYTRNPSSFDALQSLIKIVAL